MQSFAAQPETRNKNTAFTTVDGVVTSPSPQLQHKGSGAAPLHDHELLTPTHSFPRTRDLDRQQYGVAESVQSIAWTAEDVAVDRNWSTASSVRDDTYNEAPSRRNSVLSPSPPSSSRPSPEMNYTPQASFAYPYPNQYIPSRPSSLHSSKTDFYDNSLLGYDQDSLDTATSWASCSTWPSSSHSLSQWQHVPHTHGDVTERSYSSDVEYSHPSPLILPSLSRDSSLSPSSIPNPQLFTPSTSEAHLEPSIVADAFTEMMRGFDTQDAWLQPEKHLEQCYQATDSPSAQTTNHFDFPPDCASLLLNDLMQMSGQTDVLSGLLEAQPQFASLPPSAFELDQSSPPQPSSPLTLHHPRPRRLFVPRWQCDPDYDFDAFTSSLASKASVHHPGDASVSALQHSSYGSSSVPQDVSSDDEVEDYMDQDSDMDVEEEYDWEEHSPSSPPRNYSDAQEVESHSNLVGPSVRLGANVRALGPQSLLFQSVSESVKNLYSSF
ncbi:hypothetical protein EIP91_004865 [Steccherinum ochraceum]|uniref:Uncharacterized protein n=1 Tax=Steccherinum ochraceum TaxID=92696 RepID=A0A4R0RQU0_9APHY|nr:hypothetical protein EIP91_004865 [Steccherinum ochraceum]